MRRIAISGHRDLPQDTSDLVEAAIRAALAADATTVTGLSCLADGADQIFASVVLETGGQIEAIVPSRGYREGLPRQAHVGYDRLLERATVVHRLPYAASTSEAHMAASKFMIAMAGELWAVWDGQPARGLGGTADVVAYANQRDLPVKVIWPAGARRA